MKIVAQTGLAPLVERLMKTKYNKGAYVVWYLDDTTDIMWGNMMSIIKLTDKEVPTIRNESESPLDYISIKSGQGELYINGKRVEGTLVR